MNDSERDELLGRLDERSLNTLKVLEKLEKHQEKQNGWIRENVIFRRVITTVVSIVAVIVGLIIKSGRLW